MMNIAAAALMSVADKQGTYNPFNGTSPSFGPFQGLLAHRVEALIGLVWICALAFLGYRLIVAATGLHKAKKGMVGHDQHEAKEQMAWTAGALVAVAGIGAVYSTLVGF